MKEEIYSGQDRVVTGQKRTRMFMTKKIGQEEQSYNGKDRTKRTES
jgi:hypothetical protein